MDGNPFGWGGYQPKHGQYPRALLDRAIEREEDAPAGIRLDKCRIGVIGVGRGAGVTFTALFLAKALRRTGLSPALVELGCGGIFDALGMDGRFKGRPFFSFHRAIVEEKTIRARTNLDEGINWAVRQPEDGDLELSPNGMMRLIDNLSGDVVLCDFSGIHLASLSGTLIREVLRALDGVVAVIDPLPSRMLGNYPQLLELGKVSRDVLYLVNKDNKGVDRRAMCRMLGIGSPVFVPFIAPEELYGAEYGCRTVCSSAAVRKQLDGPAREILKRLLPPDLSVRRKGKMH